VLVKLVEVKRGLRGETTFLNEIYINSAHIISISEDNNADQNLVNEVASLGLLKGVKFSKVILSEGSQTRVLTVVGAPSEVHNKIKKRQVLRG
jgi:hypothetical protein